MNDKNENIEEVSDKKRLISDKKKILVKYKQKDKCVTFFFDGRMDTIKCMTAEKEIIVMLDDYEEIVFDLQNVEYIASSFLRLCGRASNTVKPGKFSIINVTPSVKKVFKIAGLADRLNLK